MKRLIQLSTTEVGVLLPACGSSSSSSNTLAALESGCLGCRMLRPLRGCVISC